MELTNQLAKIQTELQTIRGSDEAKGEGKEEVKEEKKKVAKENVNDTPPNFNELTRKMESF